MNNVTEIKKNLELLNGNSYVNQEILQKFLERIYEPLITRDENPDSHFCSFFLPFDPTSKKIFLGHHKKADDWIPPGGHIDLGETPLQTVIREFQEELQIELTNEKIDFIDVSITYIENPKFVCKKHYNLWHVVEINEQNFKYDPKEFHDASWFTFEEALMKTKRPEVLNVLKEFIKRSL
jgi:8-oxo-dGTP diphosphatase